MKIKKLLILFGLPLMVLNACKKSDDPKPTPVDPPVVKPYIPDNSFKIVAYMPSYRDPAIVADAKYRMITHLYYAFLNPNTAADGSLLPIENFSRFAAVQAKAKANNVKFGVSISGTESIFANIAASPSARTNFVKNILAFAQTNNLDGVDLDWEYPRTTNGLPSTNFTALIKELSAALHGANKYLSAAITPGVYSSTNRDAIESEVYNHVDFFNIMQYDGGVGYDANEPLNHATMKMTEASNKFWLETKAMPKNKAILGIPLYGKDNSSPVKSIGFRDIEASGADVNLNVATVNGLTYGYNGIALVKAKAQIAKDKMGGIMFWEFSHDTNSANSLIKAANDQIGRAY